MRPRGYYLTELIVSLALLTIVTGLVFDHLNRTRVETTLARACADDIVGARRALAALERDLRASTAAAVTTTVLLSPAPVLPGPAARGTGGAVAAQAGARVDDLAIETRAGPVIWRLRDGVLERVGGGRTAPITRSVRAVTWSIGAETPGLVSATIVLASRSGPAGRRAEIGTAVRLRNREPR